MPAPEAAAACRCCCGNVSSPENEKSGVWETDGKPLAALYTGSVIVVRLDLWYEFDIDARQHPRENPDTRVHSPDDKFLLRAPIPSATNRGRIQSQDRRRHNHLCCPLPFHSIVTACCHIVWRINTGQMFFGGRLARRLNGLQVGS